MKSTDEFSPGLIVEHKLFRHPGTFSSVHCALQIVVLSLWMVVTCQVKGHDLVRRNVGSIGCRTLLLPPPSAWILIPALNCQVESGRVVTKETSNNYRRKKKRVLVSLFPQTFGPQYYAEFSYRIKLYDCVVGSLWWFSHVPVTNDKDRIWNNPWFYRCFHKIARAAIGFVTSVCLSVRTEHLGWHWTDFYQIWYVSIFRKSVEKFEVRLKSDKNIGYFTRRWLFQMGVLEKIKTNFSFKNFAPRTSCRLWDNVK